jgi:hypothetical protein
MRPGREAPAFYGDFIVFRRLRRRPTGRPARDYKFRQHDLFTKMMPSASWL